MKKNAVTTCCKRGFIPCRHVALEARGFTLIELLVAVLIIAVLAAVALPQYNKVVKRAQGREVLVVLDVLDKALSAYYLENGHYSMQVSSGGQLAWRTVNQDELDMEIPPLKYFKFRNGAEDGAKLPIHSKDSASFFTDSRYDIAIYNPNAYQIIQLGTDPNYKQNLSLSLAWYRGGKEHWVCNPIELCKQYFEGREINVGTSTEYWINP